MISACHGRSTADNDSNARECDPAIFDQFAKIIERDRDMNAREAMRGEKCAFLLEPILADNIRDIRRVHVENHCEASPMAIAEQSPLRVMKNQLRPLFHLIRLSMLGAMRVGFLGPVLFLRGVFGFLGSSDRLSARL